jgi:hypothetical protein
MENAIIASTPGGIEAQEARGQRDFVASTTLPIECNGCTREQIEQMGVVFGDPVDDLFVNAQLPDGWQKKPTEHSMWSDIVDDRGRRRAAIFYKAAFYDRSAHISLERRFSCSAEPVCGYASPDYRKHEWHAVVCDCGKVIWQTPHKLEPEPEYHDDKENREALIVWGGKRDELRKAATAWLDKNYPNWKDPLAYWDEQ